MKTNEELNKLREDFEDTLKKLRELSEDELKEVTGGKMDQFIGLIPIIVM